MLAVIKILPEEIKHQIGIDFIFVLLGTVDRKHKSSSFFVLRVLPFRFNTLLEVLN